MLRFFVLYCAALAVGGCFFSSVQYHGYPSAGVQFWDEVKIGEQKPDVVRLLGSPVIIDGDAWLYPSCKVRGVVASVVRKYSCTVLKISFDGDSGTVSNIERLNTPMGRLPKIESASTPITGVNDGAWRRIESMFSKFPFRSKTQ
ncbi:hypothetical protein [Anaplasma marginale]|uniref:hypothetical protein n=1 Tax=Anaplasma marginale TaxID=770 RepID=UPI0001B467A6|nr:hypothetical protein [Anaplasma marginale]KAA8472465.1 hypothetical protein F0Q58_02935 [Anaplasma marginale]KAB0450867.1 hypothetical protein FY210_02275 [Anaplasma marginale]